MVLIPVDLMLKMFDTFVIYESGPISKQVLTLLNEGYRRLTGQQQATFVLTIVEKYLSDVSRVKNLKIS